MIVPSIRVLNIYNIVILLQYSLRLFHWLVVLGFVIRVQWNNVITKSDIENSCYNKVFQFFQGVIFSL